MDKCVKHSVRSQFKTKPLAQFLSGVVIPYQTTAEWRYRNKMQMEYKLICNDYLSMLQIVTSPILC